MLKTLLILVAALIAGLVLLKSYFMGLRNRRGLYGWSRPVQFLICLFDGIPLREVGRYPNQQAFMASFKAKAS